MSREKSVQSVYSVFYNNAFKLQYSLYKFLYDHQNSQFKAEIIESDQ